MNIHCLNQAVKRLQKLVEAGSGGLTPRTDAEIKDIAEACIAAIPTKEVRVVVYEAEIAPDATVLRELVNPFGLVAVSSIVTAGTGVSSDGADYNLALAGLSALGDPTAEVTVSGDVLDQGAAGNNDNAYTPQNINIIGDTVIWTLYSGDDGAGTDDAKRRQAIVRVFADCEFLTVQ